MSVSVTNSGGTLNINDGNSNLYPQKTKISVSTVTDPVNGASVVIRYDEDHYVQYPASQFTAPTGTAAEIAATIAGYLDSGTEVTGSGTTNYIPKWTASTTLGNSLLFDNGTTVQMGGTSAIASAQFALTSTTQGFLAPRMTTTQQDAISSPATGLLIFNTSLGLFTYYTGSAWASIDTGTNDYTQGGNAFAATGTLGLTDSNILNIITNNVVRMSIAATGAVTFGLASTTTASMILANASNANTLTINSGVTTGSYSITLPVAQGAASSFLMNNGSGVLTWNTGTGLFFAQGGNSFGAAARLGTNDAFALEFESNNTLYGTLSTTGLWAFGTIAPVAGIQFSITQAALTTGAPTAFHVISAAHTTLTASTESVGVNFNFAATKQWATGALTTQREFLVQAPTYAFVGASTITTAATLAISAAPIAGANATITNSYALWVQAGTSLFAGRVNVTPTAAATGVLSTLVVTNAANTNQTASTEISGINFVLSATREWATGGITTQREFLIQAPTYAFVGASVITTAATLAITAAPIAGTNATITTPLAFWVQSGETRLTGSGTGNTTYGLQVHNSTGTNNAFIVRDDGRVGVGVATPKGLLDIQANSGSPYMLVLTNATFGTAITNSYNTYQDTVGTVFIENASDPVFTISASAAIGVGEASFGATTRFRITGADSLSSSFSLFARGSAGQHGLSVNNIGGIGMGADAATGTTLNILAVASTALTASTESVGSNFNFSATKQFATGALTTQREILFQAPTYGFVASSTITNAATVAISAAPIAGTNATITNSYALWIQDGTSLFAGRVNVTPTAAATGVLSTAVFTNAANTNQTASTEISGVNFVLSATREWATGAITTQREFLIQAPTYAFVAGSTITNAATLAISAAPIAGTNATITNSYALWVQAGTSLFAGRVNVTPAAAATGVLSTAVFTNAANTNQTASTEISGINFVLSATREWATGAITTQREMLIQAPTYAFVGASTITNAATLAISAAPIAGTNATITNPYALWIQSGCIALVNAGAPSASVADTVQIFAADISAGNASLALRTETAVVTEVVVSDRTLSITINGTVYKVLLKS